MTIRGWCPSLHEPMATGDGLLVRVKPRGGVLSAVDVRCVAEQAGRFGNGIIELTGRGNFQIRGLTADGLAPFARAMVAAGLASADPAAERRRNVIATPLADIDPAVSPATAAVTGALETALEGEAGLAALPAKFGFLVDGGGLLSPTAMRADIRLRVLADRAEITCGVEGEIVPLDGAVATAIKLAQTLLALPPGEGWGEGVSRGEALTQPSPGGRGLLPIGVIGGLAVGGGVPFGSATASTWFALADLAERYGDAMIRLTPWRAVLMAGSVPRLALADLRLIIDPGDPRLRVSACPGQPGCGSASVATRDLASQLRPPFGTTMHVSGCEKGCAHPGPASVTLVGRAGRFDLVRHGRAGDPPVQRGLSPAQAFAA